MPSVNEHPPDAASKLVLAVCMQHHKLLRSLEKLANPLHLYCTYCTCIGPVKHMSSVLPPCSGRGIGTTCTSSRLARKIVAFQLLSGMHERSHLWHWSNSMDGNDLRCTHPFEMIRLLYSAQSMGTCHMDHPSEHRAR